MKIYKLIILCFFVLNGFSQSDSTVKSADGRKMYRKEDNGGWKEKIFLGGNLGMQFGSVTFIDVSPLVGYKFTKKFHAGLGGIYNYYSERYNVNGATIKYSTHLYGGRCFARYFIFENVFLQTGWDRINREDPFIYGQRIWVDNYLVGGGIRYPLGDRLSVMAIGLWNLNYNEYSPYRNPIIQLSFVGGF